MKCRCYAGMLLVVLLTALPSMVFGQVDQRPVRSDGLQLSDFAAPTDMKQVEARNLEVLLNKWTGKYCSPPFSGCALPAHDAFAELLNDLQAASTMPQMNAWRQKKACVDRCMVEFAPPAPDQDRTGCVAGCSAGGSPSK